MMIEIKLTADIIDESKGELFIKVLKSEGAHKKVMHLAFFILKLFFVVPMLHYIQD
jgi:hypothetical protein